MGMTSFKFCLPKYSKPLWYLNPVSFGFGVLVCCGVFGGFCCCYLFCLTLWFDLGVSSGGGSFC